MKKELISIIIPVYNIEGYLPRCLESISLQTYQHLEIIMVNDGTSDKSGEICDAFVKKDKRAKVIHQENQGLWAARNTGQRIAKGDYLLFVDGDDYLHVDMIKQMHEAINQDGGYDLAMCDRMKTERLDEDIHADEENRTTELSQQKLITNMFSHEDDVLFWYQWNKLYRRELIEGIWSNEYLRTEDLDYNFRVYLRIEKAVWIHRILYFYVQRPTSLVKAPDSLNIHYECITQLLYQNHIHLPANKNLYDYLLLKKLYIKMLFYKNRNYKTDKQTTVFEQCKEYEQATRKAYWMNNKIPLYEKFTTTLLLHSPRLTRWLMKVTNNW